MKKKALKISLLSVGLALLIAATIVINVLTLTTFDTILTQYMRSTPSRTVGDTKGADVEYFKSDYQSAKELYEHEEKIVAQIAEEGVTLLENDGLLPLAAGTTLSLFSHSSVDLVSGGSGSGSGSFELTKNLKEGLESAGLKVNEALWNFYSSGAGSSYGRGIGVINYGENLDWRINECPLSVITADGNVTRSYGDSVAMFVLSRTGGEGGDEARDMAAFGGQAGQHYLEPDATELEIISYLNNTFENVILLVNCNNAMELGWVKNYPHIKAVVNFPGAGRTGTIGLGHVLTGINGEGKEFSPSGHLVDTFVYDNFSAPATQNMGDFLYAGSQGSGKEGDKNYAYYYVAYNEGIYVGYRYYETRYEDVVTGRTNAGNYDYAQTVLYPFGYGCSYTEFEWSGFTVSEPDANGQISVNVTVKNTGTRNGKDVVQVYLQSPFTEYDEQNGVEKASVVLVGFAKTKLLAPQEEEKLTVRVNVKDFISYDKNNAKTYILEAGNYYLAAAGDAHTALNGILQKRAADGENIDTDRLVGTGTDMVSVYTQQETDKTSYSKGVNGTPITNLFDDATRPDATYLSRTNWTAADNNGLRYGTASDIASRAEVGGKQWTHELDAATRQALDSYSARNPEEGKAQTAYTNGAKNGVELIDLRGKDYADPLWDKLLDEMTLDEMTNLVAQSGYCNPEADSIAKPLVTDLDGPAGLNEVVNHGSAELGDGYLAMTWPTEYLLACTWDLSLAEEMGKGIGEDGLYSGVVGWYGPGMNLHRTPFAGRNFEYYSEDSLLSGAMGRAEVRGAAQKGMYAFIKHFALNDQETHRDHRGLITWAGEQCIRELYLKPFEMSIVGNTMEISYNEPVMEGNTITSFTMKTAEVPVPLAVMSSFNRIGATWAGGNYALITGVLRNEWGFNGFVITDYEVLPYMDTNQMLVAGGDAKLTTVNWNKYSLADNANAGYRAFARDSVHHILYTVVNSAAMNGYVHGVRFQKGFAYYKFVVIAWDILAAAGLAVMTVFLIRTIRRKNALLQEAAEGSDGGTENGETPETPAEGGTENGETPPGALPENDAPENKATDAEGDEPPQTI